MKEIQGENPPGVAEFSYPALTAVPQYQAMLRAVSDMGNASAGLLDDDAWAQLCAVLGFAARYGDGCSACLRNGVPITAPLIFPFRCEQRQYGITMHYACDRCGNVWITSYSGDR